MSVAQAALHTINSTTVRRKAVIAAVAGNLIEWYDFSVYGFVAVAIGKHFFPSDRPGLSLLTTFAVFGIGFVVRPIGGIVIGRLGDTLGRRFTLVVGIGLMTFGTALTGLLPDYATIGIAAPLLVLFARLCQGFAAGGEWGNSAAFLVEWAPEGRRGFVGSFQSCSTTVGILCASAVIAILTSALGNEAMADWGWRVPFLLAGGLGIIVVIMRRTMADPPVYHNAEGTAQLDKAAAPGSNGLRALRAVGVILPFTVGTYIFLNYMPTFVITQVKLPPAEAFWSATIAAIVSASMIPVFGAMSDRLGRKPQLLLACVLLVVLPYPLFSAMLTGTAGFPTVLAVQIAFNLTLALVGSVAASTLSELFPTQKRTTWMTAVYALTVSIFGGFAPFIATWLIQTTGQPLAPVFYVMGAGLVSFFIILSIREMAFRRLA